MLPHVAHRTGLACRNILMDTWYATKELMLFIESLGKIYYCPLNSSRLADVSALHCITGMPIRCA
ncbi:hypothetical protein [Noviherbaspirillum sp.]|jgi:hypothetical protein|uniref:hypothetical protein n=1 Tax=Noviherbaspirillum sp. TaxID=1926288 RepID=UPI0039C95F3A